MTTRYTQSHEYVRLDGDIATVGITSYAQNQLGDVVFVELPTPGQTIEKGKEAAVVESVKAASEVFAPVSGEVVEPNPELESAPAAVNEDPTGRGWFFKMRVANTGDVDSLMDQAAYDAFLKTLD